MISSSLALQLFGGASTTTGVSADLLAASARARAGIVPETNSATDPNAPLAALWTPGLSLGNAALVERAFQKRPFFDTNVQLYSDLGATGDYRRLFALHSGLTTLNALAGHAENTKLSSVEKDRTQAQFARGLSELEAFFASQTFEDIRLTQGVRADAAQTSLALPTRSEDYATGYKHRGGLYDKVAGLDPNAQFTVQATSAAGTVRTVAIDLSEMGSIPRTLGAVINHINAELIAAGAASRIEAQDLTPKETTAVVAGRVIKKRYAGPKEYGLKIDVRAGESVSLTPAASEPAFYMLGAVGGGARLIKMIDASGAPGQPVWLQRPGATLDPIGAHVASGWFGAGPPYTSSPANAFEQRSNALMSPGANNFETALRAAGDAVLKLQTADGRFYSFSAGWRSEDLEEWRTRSGESGDRAIMDDLAERLTQLMHEQGLAAGVDVWESNGDFGLSVFTDDHVRATSLSISGRAATLTTTDPSGMVGGLRDNVFARRFEATSVAGASDLFVGNQTFTIETASGVQTITIAGGTAGIDSATLTSQLNTQLRAKNIAAAASLVDVSGNLTLRVDALHDVLEVSASINGTSHDAALQAPGAWAAGGLPAASAGEPFGDARRAYTVAGGSPLLTHTGALDIEIVVSTPTGAKTIMVAVSALERANDPDPAPGEWSAAFQARLDAALNAAGVYVGASGADLTQWTSAEDIGHRIASISVNGNALPLSSAAPAFGVGGAFSAQRSFTSAQAATGVSDVVPALVTDPTVSITFDTVWGEHTVSATLQAGDARTLESAALRLNEALAAQGYDVGMVATQLAGGGAGLRAVTGGSHSVRSVLNANLGADARAFTLDPIDTLSHADDPVGALRVAERAAKGAAATLAIPAQSTLVAPSANTSGWFPGRAFDVSVGFGFKVATARAVAAGPDGSAYVIADLSGDSASSAIKGARDVALLKYDSAGKLAFSHVLGAAASASGFALAISNDGQRVAIGGALDGVLNGVSAGQGGADAFVSVFDAGGAELWTARRGSKANDQINAISFASDGSIIVAGKAEAALPGEVTAGGADGFVRGYSAAGAELFTQQFGTAGADAATALLVRDNGAGGLDIITGGVENDRGVLRKFTYAAGAGLSAGATRDIGYFLDGAVNALVADGGALYVGGEIGVDRLTLGAPARAGVAGKEGFVARVDFDLSSTTLDRATYLGSAQNDSVKSLAIVGGDVYAAGVAGDVIAGQGAAKKTSAFIARLDASGETASMRSFASAGGTFNVTGLAVSATGASVLDALGLPRGAIAPRDPGLLVNRSGLREGDEFRIGVDGRRPTTIRIDPDETLTSLAAAITRAIGGAGRAEIVRENGVERIKISARAGQALRLEEGRDGRDALGGLGLKAGLIAASGTDRGAVRSFGLELDASQLTLETPAAIARTKAVLSAATSIVRRAYDALVNPDAKELTEVEKQLEARRNSGVAPDYLRAQLANYQAALARLGG